MNNLADLSNGSHARVVRIEGVDETCVRLMEMGITPGAEVSRIGTAPLGDPIEVEIRGYRLSLRKSEAQRVIVHLV